MDSDGAEGSRTPDLLVANQITPLADARRHRNHAVRSVRCVHDVQAVTPCALPERYHAKGESPPLGHPGGPKLASRPHHVAHGLERLAVAGLAPLATGDRAARSGPTPFCDRANVLTSPTAAERICAGRLPLRVLCRGALPGDAAGQAGRAFEVDDVSSVGVHEVDAADDVVVRRSGRWGEGDLLAVGRPGGAAVVVLVVRRVARVVGGWFRWR